MLDEETLMRARARAELEQRQAFSRLETYIPIANPQHVVIKKFAPLYIELDEFQKGKQIHLLLAAAPRSTKTTTIFHAAVRRMTSKPSFLYGYGSYNVQAAREKSTVCRVMAAKAGLWVTKERTVDDPEQAFGLPSSTTYWQTLRGGGGKFTGRGGSAVGSGFGLVHIDDPVKNEEEAESETVAETNWAWMNGVMFTRRDPGGSIIVSHHRWSEDDPIGRLIDAQHKSWAKLDKAAQEMLEKVRWKYLEFPAVEGGGDPAVDDLFVPEEEQTPGWHWFSRSELLFQKANDDRTWLGMYQQQPPRRGGIMFPDRFEEWEPARERGGDEVGMIVLEEWFPVPSLEGKTLGLAVDSAGSEDSDSDMTAVALLSLWWERVAEGHLLNADVLRVWFDRLESPDVVDYVASIASSESLKGVPVGYEDQAEGRAQLRFLKRDYKHLRVVPLKTGASKRVRAISCAAGARRGRLRLPPRTNENAEWLDETLRQLKRFTGKEKGHGVDDIVDAIVHAWNMGLKLARPTKGMVGREVPSPSILQRGKPMERVSPGGIIMPGGLWKGMPGGRR